MVFASLSACDVDAGKDVRVSTVGVKYISPFFLNMPPVPQKVQGPAASVVYLRARRAAGNRWFESSPGALS